MKPITKTVFALGLLMAAPALAQDDAAEPADQNPYNKEVAIEVDGAEVLVRYIGQVAINGRTAGANRVVTRADPYRCVYTVDLDVERVASPDTPLESRRELSSDSVFAGVASGRCSSPTVDREIEREIDVRQRDFARAFERLIERDRDDVIAETQDARKREMAAKDEPS